MSGSPGTSEGATGIGGHLFWSAVARELHRVTSKRALFYERLCSPSAVTFERFPTGDAGVWDGNPHVYLDDGTDRPYDVQCVMLNDPETNYCKLDTPDRCVQRHDKHVVRQICERFGFEPKSVSPELYLTERERQDARALIDARVPAQTPFGPFVTVEPCTKDGYTVNKTYPFEKWQRVVDALREHVDVVQVGAPGSRALDGVYSAVGMTDFRGAAALQEMAALHIGSEGGLMHSARAVGTKSVVVVTGFLHPTMTCYPEDTVLWVGVGHGPCGLKVRCERCAAECAAHDPQEIIDAVMEALR